MYSSFNTCLGFVSVKPYSDVTYDAALGFNPTGKIIRDVWPQLAMWFVVSRINIISHLL